MKSMTELTKPIPVRLTREAEAGLRDLAVKTAVPFSALLRLAVQYGLPLLIKTLKERKGDE